MPGPGTPEHKVYEAERGASQSAQHITLMLAEGDGKEDWREDSSRGGCATFAASLVVWAVIITLVVLLVRYWPEDAGVVSADGSAQCNFTKCPAIRVIHAPDGGTIIVTQHPSGGGGQ